MTGSSTQGIKTVLHPVSDLAAAKAVYTALLGVPPQADASYYVGFEAAGQHIGLVPGGGPQGMTSPVAYWHVPDIEAKLAEVTAAGATVKEPAHDVGGGRLVATVTDPDGNVLGLLQDRERQPPRSGAQRRRDTEHRLTHDIDVWVASASADGAPYLVPLSFDWDGEALLVATPDGQPDRQEPGRHPGGPARAGPHPRRVHDRGRRRGARDRRAAARSGVTGSPRAPASIRVPRPRRTAGSASPRAASRLGAR